MKCDPDQEPVDSTSIGNTLERQRGAAAEVKRRTELLGDPVLRSTKGGRSEHELAAVQPRRAHERPS